MTRKERGNIKARLDQLAQDLHDAEACELLCRQIAESGAVGDPKPITRPERRMLLADGSTNKPG